MSASPNDSKFLGETKKQYEVRVTQPHSSADRAESPDYSFLPNGNGYSSTFSTKPEPTHQLSLHSLSQYSSVQDFTPDSSPSSTNSEYSSSNSSEGSQFSSQNSQSSNNSSHSTSSNDYDDEDDLSHEEEQLARTYKPVFLLNKFNNIDSFVKYDNENSNSNGIVAFSIPITGSRNINSSKVNSSMDTTGDKPKSGANLQSSHR